MIHKDLGGWLSQGFLVYLLKQTIRYQCKDLAIGWVRNVWIL